LDGWLNKKNHFFGQEPSKDHSVPMFRKRILASSVQLPLGVSALRECPTITDSDGA